MSYKVEIGQTHTMTNGAKQTSLEVSGGHYFQQLSYDHQDGKVYYMQRRKKRNNGECYTVYVALRSGPLLDAIKAAMATTSRSGKLLMTQDTNHA